MPSEVSVHQPGFIAGVIKSGTAAPALTVRTGPCAGRAVGCQVLFHLPSDHTDHGLGGGGAFPRRVRPRAVEAWANSLR